MFWSFFKFNHLFEQKSFQHHTTHTRFTLTNHHMSRERDTSPSTSGQLLEVWPFVNFTSAETWTGGIFHPAMWSFTKGYIHTQGLTCPQDSSHQDLGIAKVAFAGLCEPTQVSHMFETMSKSYKNCWAKAYCLRLASRKIDQLHVRRPAYAPKGNAYHVQCQPPDKSLHLFKKFCSSDHFIPYSWRSLSHWKDHLTISKIRS